MRSYQFYLYRADGALTGRQVLAFDTDSQARRHAPAMFALYQDCDELELWEGRRHVAHTRRLAQPETLRLDTDPIPVARGRTAGARQTISE